MPTTASEAVIDLVDEWVRYCSNPNDSDSGNIFYGPSAPESQLKLLGDVAGKRVVVLGADPHRNAMTLAAKGAHVVVVEPSPVTLNTIRFEADSAGVRLDARIGDFADLAFLLADTIDVCISAWSFAFSPDLGRALRQVHRILKPGATLIFGIPHPAAALIEAANTTEAANQPVHYLVQRSWFDIAPVRYGPKDSAVHHRRIPFADIYPELARASLRLDTYTEPEPMNSQPSMLGGIKPMTPASLVCRVRKDLS